MTERIVELEIQNTEVDKVLFHVKNEYLEKLGETQEEYSFDSKICMSIRS